MSKIFAIILGFLGVFFLFYVYRAISGAEENPSGIIVQTNIRTTHHYPNGPSSEQTPVWSYTLKHPGASSLRAHFSHVDLADDELLIMDGNGRIIATYPQPSIFPFKKSDFWTIPVMGDSMTIELRANATRNAYGFDMLHYSYLGFPSR